VAYGCYRDSRAATLPIATAIQVDRTLGLWRRNVARFVALTGFAKGKLVEGGFPEGRISVLPNFAPGGPRRNGPGEFFAFVGRLSEEKAPEVLADAWDPSLGRVVFVGDGPLRDRVAAALAPHGESATCLGARPPEETRELIGRARAVVLTSRVYEACPSVIGEAYAAGVPVVAPDFGSFADLVAHEETGLLFPPGDPDGLRACLRRLADDDLSARLGDGARRLYEERFSPEGHRSELEAIYGQALAAKRWS
jgi:glycosyltransferase involved in cell wall biosynthesis